MKKKNDNFFSNFKSKSLGYKLNFKLTDRQTAIYIIVKRKSLLSL